MPVKYDIPNTYSLGDTCSRCMGSGLLQTPFGPAYCGLCRGTGSNEYFRTELMGSGSGGYSSNPTYADGAAPRPPEIRRTR